MKQIVRAMSDGILAAECLDRFLLEGQARRPAKTFSSVMGRLDPGETELFVRHASNAARVAASRNGDGYTIEEAILEAARCIHCDCRATGDCKLQHYSTIYGANPARFREQRRRFEQNVQHASVLYEPGKCIRCGICVRLTELAQEPLGLTFIGRGFDVRIDAPLNGTLAEGLRKTAAECVEGCPTGALVFREGTPL